jgi:hypothetical protein
MAKTATADTARSADLTAAVGRKYTHYVRVVQPGACSRCAILAGIDSYSTAFKRHPACRCTSMPVDEVDASPARLFASPDDYFRTLTTAEQDRIFTKAGAEAIRAGADPVTVVTARSQATGIAYSRRGINPGTLPNSGRRLQRTVIGLEGRAAGVGVHDRGSDHPPRPVHEEPGPRRARHHATDPVDAGDDRRPHRRRRVAAGPPPRRRLPVLPDDRFDRGLGRAPQRARPERPGDR